MASESSVAVRRANAQERITLAAGDLAAALKVEPLAPVPQLVKKSGDPNLFLAVQLENFADFLEVVLAKANKKKPLPPAA